MITRLLRRSWVSVLFGVALIALTVAPTGAQEALPRNETLYVAGMQWSTFQTFNPLAAVATFPAIGENTYTYETLFAFNVATGNLDPLLAKDLTFTDETTAVVTLHDGTHWQDGEPLTVDDVVFTYELAKEHNVRNYSDFWLYVDEVTATGDRTIEFKLNPDRINAGLLKRWLSNAHILPQHIWAERAESEDLVQFVETDPVGSGPYKVLDYSIERIALVRDDNYWGASVYGLPAPKYIVHPIFASNDEGNLAFQNGQVDLSQQFAPQIWKMWEDLQLPVGTYYKEPPYHIPGNIPLLHINTHRPGLDNVLVRRALAYSINYAQIAEVAMSRYSAPAQASLIIPEGGEAQYFNAEQVAELGWEYDPAEAQRILEEDLGATKGDDGIYVLPDGTRLGPYTAMAVYGWTDWQTAVEIAAQNATEAGIEVVTEFPEQPVLYSRRNAGDFDLLIFTYAGATPASPWQRFRDALDIRGVPDFGESANWNWGRFEHPDVADLLDQAAAATDLETQKELFSALDRIFLENIPVIPLMYRPLEFYEFNESVWTGFPTADNPVAPPMHEEAGVELLYVIEPKE
ncbi:MAG: ABC transporter substrate-binding protein [Anaerolineae bacterium]